MFRDLSLNFVLSTRGLRAVTEVHLLVMSKADVIMAASLGEV